MASFFQLICLQVDQLSQSLLQKKKELEVCFQWPKSDPQNRGTVKSRWNENEEQVALDISICTDDPSNDNSRLSMSGRKRDDNSSRRIVITEEGTNVLEISPDIEGKISSYTSSSSLPIRRTLKEGEGPTPTIPQLPMNILVSVIARFVGDRKTINSLILTCREVRNGCIEMLTFPWPNTTILTKSRLWAVAFSPDNRTLVLGGTDGSLRLFDRRKGATGILRGHLGRVYDIVFTTDGSTMMTLSGDGDLRIWDMNHRLLMHQISTRTTHSVCLAFNAATSKLATGGQGDIRIYSIPNGAGLDVLTMERNRFLVESLCFSPGGKTLAVGIDGNAIQFWDLAARKCISSFQELSSVHSIDYSPDGCYVVSGTDSHNIRVWCINSGGYKTLTGHKDMVWSVAFSPDGKQIASASDDGTIRLWNSETGRCMRIINTFQGSSVYGVAFSPDGRTVASASDNGCIELCKV